MPYRHLLHLLLPLTLIACQPALPPTASVTATLTTTPANTPTPEPTATSAPTPTVAPPLTATPWPLPPLELPLDATYQLAPPSPDNLLNLLLITQQQTGYFYNASISVAQADSFGHALDFEFRRHYPDGLPNPVQVFTALSELQFGWTSPLIYELVDAGFLGYLNHNNIRLIDQQPIITPDFTAEVHQLEFDGDPLPEWLYGPVSGQLRIASWLVLDETPTGQYHRLAGHSPGLSGQFVFAEHIAVVAGTTDMTDDGLSDVLFATETYTWGTLSLSIEITQGSPAGIEYLETISRSGPADFNGRTNYALESSDDGGLPILTLTQNQHINWGCTWDKTETYRWPGGISQYTVASEHPPDTANCALAQGVSVRNPPDNQTAIQHLTHAITLFENAEEPAPGLEAFARYRLAVEYARAGNDTAARQQLHTILSAADEGIDAARYLSAGIEEILATPVINPVSLCAIPYIALREGHGVPQSWENYVGASPAVHAYPFMWEPWGPALCPLTTILEEHLAKIEFTPDESPQLTLEAAGLPVTLAQPITFPPGSPDNSIDTWIVLLDIGQLRLMHIFPDQTGDQWYWMHTFKQPAGDLAWLNEDVTGDGRPEFALLYPITDDWYPCEDTTSAYELFVLASTRASGGGAMFSHKFCHPTNETIDLRDWLADTDGDGFSDWVLTWLDENDSSYGIPPRLYEDDSTGWIAAEELAAMMEGENLPPISDDKATVILELAASVYAGENLPQTRQQLQQLLSITDPDDIYTRHHITWLIALTHELEGHTPQAIQQYLALSQTQPPTLWSHLAAAKLVQSNHN